MGITVLELIDGGFIGGGQTHILSLVKGLDPGKFISVIAASPGAFEKLVRDSGFEFMSINLGRMYSSRNLKELDRIVRENNIDIIHSHGGVAGMYSRFHKKKIGTAKVIHTFHGIHYIRSGNPLRKHLTHAVEEYLVPFGDRYICVSEADLALAVKLNITASERTEVINNGINLSVFAGREKDKVLMDQLGLNHDDLVIGMISRFDHQKNQRFILNNVRQLLNDNRRVKILLAGSGKYLAACKAVASAGGISDRVIFTGEITNPEKYYSLIDIFVFPSMWEGLSIALIEAMASGRCILASNIDANWELITDESNGLLFDLDNPREYMEKLSRLISDASLRTRLGRQAAEDSQRYSAEGMCGQISDLYEEVLVK